MRFTNQKIFLEFMMADNNTQKSGLFFKAKCKIKSLKNQKLFKKYVDLEM
jgi:hypothetical protein